MKYIFLLLGVSFLAGCSSSDQADEEKPKGGVIGEAYIESLEEAEAVEDLAIERGDRIADEIEAAEDPN